MHCIIKLPNMPRSMNSIAQDNDLCHDILTTRIEIQGRGELVAGATSSSEYTKHCPALLLLIGNGKMILIVLLTS